MSRHPIQQQMVQLATQHDIANMRLVDIAALLGGGIALQRIKHHRAQLIKHGELPEPTEAKRVTVTKYPGGLELVKIPILGVVR